MTPQLITDPDTVRARLLDEVRRDPVRGTLLGTVAATIGPGGWLAVWDGGLAARSAPNRPVILAGRLGDAAAGVLDLVRRPDGVHAVNGVLGEVQRLLELLPPEAVTARRDDRLYRLDRLVEPEVRGAVVVATDEHRDLVAQWYAAFDREVAAAGRDEARAAAERLVRGGGCFLWLDPDGRPVSLAARRASVEGSARIGPVYTPPEHRGHGYASGVTAEASRSILAEGSVPVLFTDLANPTSNKIYAALGYEPVEDRVLVTLG
ncbi:MAG: GNAT family N-acetyltransferase [Jatrophihabitans sp.]|uniref:GNAT family N-acetyltransferase n=1 Tax=Jatrophihabitans sp. TaxID=1932789 RepID=UPI003F7D3788